MRDSLRKRKCLAVHKRDKVGRYLPTSRESSLSRHKKEREDDHRHHDHQQQRREIRGHKSFLLMRQRESREEERRDKVAESLEWTDRLCVYVSWTFTQKGTYRSAEDKTKGRETGERRKK